MSQVMMTTMAMTSNHCHLVQAPTALNYALEMQLKQHPELSGGASKVQVIPRQAKLLALMLVDRLEGKNLFLQIARSRTQEATDEFALLSSHSEALKPRQGWL